MRHARILAERFSPDTGVPLRVGEVWPPRLVLHNVCTKVESEEVQLTVTAWMAHVLRSDLTVTLRAAGAPTDPDGEEVQGLEIRPSTVQLPGTPSARRIPGLDAGRKGYHPLPLTLRWRRSFCSRLQDLPWIRQALDLELSDGDTTRVFRWYAYLTPHAAELPRSNQFDDHPHFRWVDHDEGPLVLDAVAHAWIELPAPMSSPSLPPACWVQFEGEAPNMPGPDAVQLVPVFPMEPPLQPGMEAVGWNGALGGHDPRPRVQALPVASQQAGDAWAAWLHYWDTPGRGHSRPTRLPRITPLEEPTPCVWPEVVSADPRPLVLHDLVGRGGTACEIKVNVLIGLPDTAEAVRLERADIRLGNEDVGRWEGPPVDLAAAQTLSLPCVLDLKKLRDASDGRLRLTVVFYGRPLRGVVRGVHVFRTDNGPFARLNRSRTRDGQVRSPWLTIDLGTEGTCAAVAFLDGYLPRVISVAFDEGPVYPTRVYLAPGVAAGRLPAETEAREAREARGVAATSWSLTDEPGDDSLYTTLVKLGLRFGEGAHPGCPDHIAATEVARFFLKRFLLEVKDRMAWFPLEEADVLVAFPPRLASMPRFVEALRETFSSVLGEVLWTGPDGVSRPRRLRFREEGFLVAVPALYRDLEVAPMPPGGSRYYWVMDFGGGTTDVCGFLCTADRFGEEHVVSHMTYPQRLPHHLAGHDVTAAFYRLLRQHLEAADLVADGEGDEAHHRRFPIPPTPQPSVRSTASALLNQSTVRELADALKCLDPEEHGEERVRAVVRRLRNSRVRSVDGVTTTLAALLAVEARQIGDLTVAEVHRQVLEPEAAPGAAAPKQEAPAEPVLDAHREKATVQCGKCEEPHILPLWAFASSRPFRFRCRACGHGQRVRLQESQVPELDPVEATPMILEYRDVRVQERAGDVSPDELYVEQDGRTYVVRDWDTLRRWVVERRVSPDDLFSEGGVSWQALRERGELRDLFQEAEVVAVDTTQEVPKVSMAELTGEGGPRVGGGPAASTLGRDIELFLTASREALERALSELPTGPDTDVVVLVAGRASQFGPIARGIHQHLPGRVVHLTNDWVRRTYGNAGQIDPNAGLKTLTANGGGLFSVLQSNQETSHLLLSFDTQVMDCELYLQSAAAVQPWLITRRLDLRPGVSIPLVRGSQVERAWVEDLGTSAQEPPSRPLPQETALTGELRLVVSGLPEDREVEPYVTVARGTAKRIGGRRARVTAKTALRTERGSFVLERLSEDREIEFLRMLPRLPLLGGSGAGGEVTDEITQLGPFGTGGDR